MFSQDSLNIGSMETIPANSQYDMPEMMQPCFQAASNPVMENAMTYRAIYPEIYYKLLPYISMTCDSIFSYGMMPTMQQMEEMSDGIFDDFCAMYPDMSDYMGNTAVDTAFSSDSPSLRGGFGGDEDFREGFTGGEGFGEGFIDSFRDGFRPGYRRFRRRGLGRDLIFSLLLSELLGRGGFVF